MITRAIDWLDDFFYGFFHRQSDGRVTDGQLIFSQFLIFFFLAGIPLSMAFLERFDMGQFGPIAFLAPFAHFFSRRYDLEVGGFYMVIVPITLILNILMGGL